MTKNLRVKTSKFIDETYKVSFKFNGKTYYGFKGDTLASALLANDIHLVGRSFKYHRPRGIMSAGSEEPNAIVQLHNNSSRTEPNVRATEIEIYEGLEATSQNCWPSVNFDIGGINNFLSPILPAGFYYKTFMWPASFWEKYEFFIRHSAGLGKSPTKPDTDLYDHQYAHCDVLVIGGGISGILSAKLAAEKVSKVITATKGPLKDLKDSSQEIIKLAETGQIKIASDIPSPDDAKLADTFKETNLRWNNDVGAFETTNGDIASQSDIKKYAADNPMEVKVGEEPIKAATNKSVLSNVGKALARVGAPLPTALIDSYFISKLTLDLFLLEAALNEKLGAAFYLDKELLIILAGKFLKINKRVVLNKAMWAGFFFEK